MSMSKQSKCCFEVIAGQMGHHHQRRPRPGFHRGLENAEFFGGFHLRAAAEVERVKLRAAGA